MQIQALVEATARDRDRKLMLERLYQEALKEPSASPPAAPAAPCRRPPTPGERHRPERLNSSSPRRMPCSSALETRAYAGAPRHRPHQAHDCGSRTESRRRGRKRRTKRTQTGTGRRRQRRPRTSRHREAPGARCGPRSRASTARLRSRRPRSGGCVRSSPSISAGSRPFPESNRNGSR